MSSRCCGDVDGFCSFAGLLFVVDDIDAWMYLYCFVVCDVADRINVDCCLWIQRRQRRCRLNWLFKFWCVLDDIAEPKQQSLILANSLKLTLIVYSVQCVCLLDANTNGIRVGLILVHFGNFANILPILVQQILGNFVMFFYIDKYFACNIRMSTLDSECKR